MGSSRHKCPNSCVQHKWFLFFLSSIATFLVGVGSVLLCRGISLLRKSRRQAHESIHSSSDSLSKNKKFEKRRSLGYEPLSSFSLPHKESVSWMSLVKDWAGATISGQTVSGRVLIVTVFLMSMVSLGLFFYHAARDPIHNCYPIEICISFSQAPTQQFDFALNIFFILHFTLRFLSASDKLWFWMEMYTLVDILTVPPSILSVYLNHYWLGLRFTRALRLLSFPDVLQYLNVLRTTNAIRLCQLITVFLSLLLTTAGCIHLAENTGEPYDENIGQDLSYFECIYFMVVTLSTVGYGDYSCKTTTARVFLILFILFGLAVFANSAPEIAEIIGSRKKHRGVYMKENGRIHIVLCGHITHESVANFLADFLHKDREDIGANIVILDQHEPDLEMQGLLKRHYTRVEFFQGSIMKAKDLHRVALKSASACIVLANKYCHDPDAEDAANIMRVISVKNYSEDIKVIIQLMQYHNKTYLLNIPSWNAQRGDEVLCLAELKLGFLAQSCLCPGFSTLLANLFTMRSFERTKSQPKWLNEYLEGAGMEMYAEHFSPAFDGMSFPEVTWLCFSKLKLLLLAVEVSLAGSSERHIAINPKSSLKVHHSMQGFFIAQSAEDVKRVYNYCNVCHSRGYRGGPSRPGIFGKCTCGRLDNIRKTGSLEKRNKTFTSVQQNEATGELCEMVAANVATNMTAIFNTSSNTTIDQASTTDRANFQRQQPSLAGSIHAGLTKSPSLQEKQKIKRLNVRCNRKFDASGMHHWCVQRTFDEAIIGRDPRTWPNLTDHIVVCVFADATSPLIGLCNFLMPLRASNIHFSELKQVVFIGNAQYLRREWKMLMNFPKVFIFPATPLKRVNLRAVNINQCAMCVIISAKQACPYEDQTLVDKEAILCSLNIKAMRFDGSQTGGVILGNAGGINNTWPMGILPKSSGITNSSLLLQEKEPMYVNGDDIPLLTELAMDNNVQFLDQDDDDDPGTELYMTQPFACGTTFVVSVLDSLMSTTFFNKNALTIIRTLVTGKSSSPSSEPTRGAWSGQSDGAGSSSGGEEGSLDLQCVRDRCRVTQLTVGEGLLSQFNHSHTYGQLVQEALKRCSILCIGLYRCVPNQRKNSQKHNPTRRYVITNPPADCQLQARDRVFCLKPYHLVIQDKRQSTPDPLLSATSTFMKKTPLVSSVQQV